MWRQKVFHSNRQVDEGLIIWARNFATLNDKRLPILFTLKEPYELYFQNITKFTSININIVYCENEKLTMQSVRHRPYLMETIHQRIQSLADVTLISWRLHCQPPSPCLQDAALFPSWLQIETPKSNFEVIYLLPSGN